MNAIQLVPTVMKRALDLQLNSLSELTRRQYAHTLNRWMAYCDSQNIPRHDMTVEHISAYLESEDIGFNTKKTRLSHLRNFIKTMYACDPSNEYVHALYEQLKILKVIRSEQEKDNTQTKNALTNVQVKKLFGVFPDNSLLHMRNRALLAFLFGTGVRRSEARRLTWSDVDMSEQLVTIRHGKGDKSRQIPIVYHWEYIQAWHDVIGYRRFIMCGVTKGDKIAKDKPITTKTIYRIIRQVSIILGIDELSPHDARRTLITDLLNKGVSVSDVQFIAGHANPETTLGYAVNKDAIATAQRIRDITKKPSN